MFLRILKKDLKRKKTMNIILLIFIILAATFIASSVNNLVTISSALKGYFKKAGLSDYLIVTIKDEKNDVAIADFLDKNEYVDRWVRDENIYVNAGDIKLDNGEGFSMSSTGMVSRLNINQQKFFDYNNNEITNVNDGEIYMPIAAMENNNLAAGDIITIVTNDSKMNFTIAGNCKDAFLGSTMMGNTRFIVSDTDYLKIKESINFGGGYIYSINTPDVDALDHDFNQMGFNVVVSCDHSMISITYVMDMIIAGVLLIVSICLILISLVILRFTIVFTLNEEFREIGVMKAIGLRTRKIRELYIVKYLAISVIGAFIGFLLSLPFGNMFMKQVSKNIVIAAGSKGLIINGFCSILIVLIVLLFCYTCTHHVNKFSPVDAIRSGSNGERYKRKGVLRLYKGRLSTIAFMALNNILSEPKRFAALIITFTLGIILVIVPINTISTLSSEQLVLWFGMAKSDVYMVNDNVQIKFLSADGREHIRQYFSDMKSKLKENDMDASIFTEMAFKFKITKGDYGYNAMALQGTGISAEKYMYTKGQSPIYENEVALTHITANKIGAGIGDTVIIKTGEKENEYIVTAIFQSMTNLGEGIRFSEKAEIDYSYAIGGMAIQIKFNDNLTDQEVEERFDRIKELYPDFRVFTGGEYIQRTMGDIAGQLEGMKQVIVIVILSINMLVAVLMVKTFITKEKGEIGMLKSIGFRNSAIVKWQVLRIGIILFISTIIGAIISNPIAQISSGKVFEMMGASHIEFVVKPLEVYVMYPLIILVLTMLASGFAALQIRNISVQETNNIE